MLNINFLKELAGDSLAVEYHPKITSTNDRALEMARAGMADGQLIVAEHQINGRGRRGNSWQSAAGGSLLCSLLLRSASPLPVHHLAIISGVGCANALNEIGFPVKIKWPNDLMLADRKVAGILVETHGDAVVIGIGVNYALNEDFFSEDVRNRAISLNSHADLLPEREMVITKIALGLQQTMRKVESGGIIKILLEWNKMNWLARRKVRVCGPFGEVDGDGLFLDGRSLHFHVFKDHGVVTMPLSSTVEAK